MNSTIYIFGDFGYGCNQYPNDYTSDIFSQFHKSSQANTQLTIHRDDNMMYYGYVRKLHNREQYIGICVVLNGFIFKEVKTLFNRFENYITDIVVHGQIIEFSNDGNLISKVTNLYECQNEIERINKFIQNDIETLTTQKLPPTNLSIGKNESKSFLIEDKAEKILEATYNYGYTYVYKDTGYNTGTLTSYSGKLYTLNKEKTDAIRTIENQKQEISNLKTKQKNYKLVIWLIIIIFIGLIVGFNFLEDKNRTISNLNFKISKQEQEIDEKKETIKSLNNKIDLKESEIGYKNSKIKNLESDLIIKGDSLRSLQNEKNKLEKELKKYKDISIPDNLPIYVKYIEIANVDYNGNIYTNFGTKIYSSSTMYLQPRIRYVGIDTYSYITLKVKIYTPSGYLSKGKDSPKDATYESKFTVENGINSKTLIGWGGNKKGHWSKGKYTIEIWYKDVCLKTQVFTIY